MPVTPPPAATAHTGEGLAAPVPGWLFAVGAGPSDGPPPAEPGAAVSGGALDEVVGGGAVVVVVVVGQPRLQLGLPGWHGPSRGRQLSAAVPIAATPRPCQGAAADAEVPVTTGSTW